MRITPLDQWIRDKTGLCTLTPAALRGYQLEKLRETAAYASRRSRFYGRRAAGLAEVTSFADFEALPFTAPGDIADEANAFLCVPPDEVSRIVTLQTSGTTGRRKRLFFTPEDQELTVDFFHRGMQTLTAPGARVMILLPGDTPGGVGDLLAQALKRLGAVSRVYGPVRDYEAARRALFDFRPDTLVGLPQQIYRLARTAPRARPGSVLLASDYISPALAGAVGDAWRCKVFSHYGLTESGLGGAVSCEAGAGYHMREADLYFEIIDPETGAALPDGEYGEVVFTTLTRRAMPLVRYRTGDLSRIIPGLCPCGSSLRRLDRITGRRSERITLRGGGTLSITQLDDILYGYPQVLAFSARLDCAETLTLTVSCLGAMPDMPELGALPVRVIVRPGEPSFFSAGTLKRAIDTD